MTSKNLLIKILSYLADFYFYHILNNVNVKVKVEQTDLVTHSIITVQLHYIYYLLSKNPSGQLSSKW